MMISPVRYVLVGTLALLAAGWSASAQVFGSSVVHRIGETKPLPADAVAQPLYDLDSVDGKRACESRYFGRDSDRMMDTKRLGHDPCNRIVSRRSRG